MIEKELLLLRLGARRHFTVKHLADCLAQPPTELDRYCVADLPMLVENRPREAEAIWKGLEAGTLANGQAARGNGRCVVAILVCELLSRHRLP